MNKDKNVPFTIEEEKKLAKPRYLANFFPLFLILGFFMGFGGFVVLLIGLVQIEENLILVYVGSPLFVVGVFLFVLAFLTQSINKKVYEKMCYRLLKDNFKNCDITPLDFSKKKNTFLKEANIINVKVDSLNKENFLLKKVNTEIEVYNVEKSTAQETSQSFLNDLFTVSSNAVVGEKKLDLSLSFKGVVLKVCKTKFNLSNPIEIRTHSANFGASMNFDESNLLELKDNFGKLFDVYVARDRFYELLTEELKEALIKFSNTKLSLLLIIKNSEAYILIKDLRVAPHTLLRRDDKKIYEAFSKYSHIYFLIDQIIDSLIS